MLAPYLPVAVPVPIGLGVPSEEYPWPWIVYGWLDGEVAVEDRLVDAAGAGTPRPRAAIAELHGSIETDAAATWARGRGWALSMALIQLPYYQIRMPREQCEAWIDLLVGWTEQITRTIGAGAPLTLFCMRPRRRANTSRCLPTCLMSLNTTNPTTVAKTRRSGPKSRHGPRN